jgi:hypothetical protein
MGRLAAVGALLWLLFLLRPTLSALRGAFSDQPAQIEAPQPAENKLAIATLLLLLASSIVRGASLVSFVVKRGK